mmetsp:Transcript_50567/g.81722  ORF Transcript_50567/g.81722 Transcript_50567/m.81722 type:complete len:220 (-) Transcript_50567:30-689(-)
MSRRSHSCPLNDAKQLLALDLYRAEEEEDWKDEEEDDLDESVEAGPSPTKSVSQLNLDLMSAFRDAKSSGFVIDSRKQDERQPAHQGLSPCISRDLENTNPPLEIVSHQFVREPPTCREQAHPQLGDRSRDMKFRTYSRQQHLARLLGSLGSDDAKEENDLDDFTILTSPSACAPKPSRGENTSELDDNFNDRYIQATLSDSSASSYVTAPTSPESRCF